MATFRRLKNASAEYAREEEDLFRRDLENYLLALSSEVTEAINGNSGTASIASKRTGLITNIHYGYMSNI